MIATLIFIPVVILIGNGSGDWSERKTTDGLNVYVKKTGDGEYVDSLGTTYREKDE